MARILVIEDEPAVMRTIAGCLAVAGHQAITAGNGRDGLARASSENPDLIVLDVELPDMSGFDVCSELRRLRVGLPVLMLTGLQSIENRVHGLDAGADDYMSKPFDVEELLARVRALLRRPPLPGAAKSPLEFGDVVVDFVRRTATRAGAPLALTKTEFALLELLAEADGRPISRSAIFQAVWGYERMPNTRTVDTHIWRLRKKIGDAGDEPRWLKHISGQGYALVP